jgi:precorrin-6B methylase 2
MNKFKYSLYAFARWLIPQHTQQLIGGSAFLRPLRDRFFRPKIEPEIIGNQISFGCYSFFFSAPYQVYYHAKSSGIEAGLSRCAMSQLKSGSVAIDVGASYGFLTIIMALSVKPTGKVLSFEPDLNTYNILKSNINNNSLDSNCLLLKKAVGSIDDDNTITLDRFLQQNGFGNVNFIKIDVDGDDFNVLLGAKNMLRRNHPVVVVEMEKNQYAIYDLLNEIGYSHFYNTAGKKIAIGEWPPNLVAAINEIKIPQRGDLKKNYVK